jgi:ABC-type bacteriocin/lantibiotic exporter with double-glycine peptidase domain
MNLQKTVDVLANFLKNIEEIAHYKNDAVILPHFQRSIQLDYYSCGARSVYSILRYYGKRCTPESVKRSLDTNEDGTAVSDILRVFRQRGLSCRIIKNAGLVDVKKAIHNGWPVLVSLYDGWHYATVYGFSEKHLFVCNPSVDTQNMGAIFCAVPKRKFSRMWERWCIIVRE